MADRCFANTLRDYDCDEDNNKKRSDGEGPEPDDVLLKAAISLKDEVIQATWLRQGRRVSDPTLYTGALGTAFLCFKAYHITGSKPDLALCCEIVDSCAAAAQRMKKSVTFLAGQPGIYALGAAAANCSGDQRSLDRYLGLFYEASKNKALAAVGGEDGLPYELLYGRAGFLWAALFLRKHVGEEAVPATITDPIVDAILAGGREGASATRSLSPLMYEWHGTKYWGAAHGLAGIMHTLMHFPVRAKEDAEDVKATLRYMIRGRFPGGNYPSSDGKGSDRLVHWCHGAPGVAMTLCKAAEVFPEDAAEFRKAAVEAGDVVWQRGLLRKLGLCHGISGNTYVFLALHRAMGEGEEEKQQQQQHHHHHHLFRARQFASFLCKHGRALVESGEIHGGDRPYSLFEGLAGTACLLFDVTKPETTSFPAYEL